MKKIENRWKEEDGRVAATLLDIWNFLRECAKKCGATPDLLGWTLTPKGREVVESAVCTVVEVWKTTVAPAAPPEKQEKPAPLRMKADLNADPTLPFAGAMFDGTKGSKHARQGAVELEYRPDEDELYVNGRRWVPFLSEKQLGGKMVRGYDLRAEAETNNPTNATLADVLYEHQEFIPKKFRNRVWPFWATIFSDSVVRLYVRYLHWLGGRWRRDFLWLGYALDEHFLSASLASEDSKLGVQTS